jgi:hypothetical protein
MFLAIRLAFRSTSDGQYCAVATQSIVQKAKAQLGASFVSLISGHPVTLSSTQKDLLNDACSDPCWVNLATAAARSGASLAGFKDSDLIADNVANLTEASKLALFCIQEKDTNGNKNFCIEDFSVFSSAVGLFSATAKRRLGSADLKVGIKSCRLHFIASGC